MIVDELVGMLTDPLMQRALLAAARTVEAVEAMAGRLRANGFTSVDIGEQRDRGDLLAHVLEGIAP